MKNQEFKKYLGFIFRLTVLNTFYDYALKNLRLYLQQLFGITSLNTTELI